MSAASMIRIVRNERHCPFCGSGALAVVAGTRTGAQVECECGARGPVVDGDFERGTLIQRAVLRADAYAAWNRRAGKRGAA